jgi:hypothetical protein
MISYSQPHRSTLVQPLEGGFPEPRIAATRRPRTQAPRAEPPAAPVALQRQRRVLRSMKARFQVEQSQTLAMTGEPVCHFAGGETRLSSRSLRRCGVKVEARG